jgi:hypothetical protein
VISPINILLRLIGNASEIIDTAFLYDNDHFTATFCKYELTASVISEKTAAQNSPASVPIQRYDNETFA